MKTGLLSLNARTLATVIGMVWLAVSAGPVQALVDWNASFQATGPILSQIKGDRPIPLYRNRYGWYRSVQAWQSFTATEDAPLSAISLQLQYAKARAIDDSSTVDLNVYEGIGVEGTLISSTKLEWNTDFDGGWHTFALGMPVTLKKNGSYTFAVENLIADQALAVVVNDRWAKDGVNLYMQQGYYGMVYGTSLSTAPPNKGYVLGSDTASINHILWK